MSPPGKMTPRQWHDYNVKMGNVPAFDYPDLEKRIDTKHLEYYNPKAYSRNPQGGFINTQYPNATMDDPEYGSPFIKYNAPVEAKNSVPFVQPDPNHKPIVMSPYQNYNPNTNVYTDPKTNKKIDPVVEQYNSGGLVKKIKGYDDGGVVTPVKKDYSKAAGLANTAADGLTMAGQFGSTLINNDPNEEGQIDPNKAGWQGALGSAGAGAKMGGTLGSFAGPLGTVVGTGVGALAGGIYGFTKGKDAAEDANKAAEEQRIAEEKEKRRLLGDQSVNAALSQRALENYADGGQVRGPGGPKDDKIKTAVPDGSFVVPAENAGLAKKLRNEVLTPVKLSNGEHLFTPEEVAILEARGINLDALAPEAKTKLKDAFKNGGHVFGYADGGKVGEREKLKREKERLAAEAASGEKKKAAEASRRQVNQYVYSQLEKQLRDKSSAKNDLDISTKEYEAIKAAYDKYSTDSDTELGRGQTTAEKYTGGKSVTPADVIKQKEDLLSKVEAAEAKMNKAKKALEFASTESNYVSPRKGLAGDIEDKYMINPKDVPSAAEVALAKTGEKPYEVDPRSVPSADELYKPTGGLGRTTSTPAPAAGTEATNGLSSQAMRNLTPSMEGDAGEGAAPSTVPQPGQGDKISGGMDYNVDPAIAGGADNVATQTGADKSNPGFSVDANGILRNVFNYGVPLLQTALGKKFLDQAGERPIDKFDPEYQKSIDAARKDLDLARANAKFGFTAEEQAMINQNNANALSQGRASARNYSGGSAANAYNLEMGAINNSFSQGLAAKVQDKQLQLEKQGLAQNAQRYLDNLVSGGTDIKRRLYKDADTRYMQNQEVGGNLVGQGLTNLVEAGRYDAELEAYKKRLNQYGQ